MPRLRALDLRSVVHGQRRAVLLVDPLGLSGKQVVVPSELLPMLQLCDGTRSPGALRAALAVRYGQAFSATVIEQALAALDEALLLDNARYHVGSQRIAWRSIAPRPSRPMVIAGESYPADPEQLAPILDGFLARVERPAGHNRRHPRGSSRRTFDYGRGAPVYAAVCGSRWLSKLADIDLVFMLGTDPLLVPRAHLTLTPQHATLCHTLWGDPDRRSGRECVSVRDRSTERSLCRRASPLLSEHSIELAAVWLHHLTRGEGAGHGARNVWFAARPPR